MRIADLFPWAILILLVPSAHAGPNVLDPRLDWTQLTWLDRGLYFMAADIVPCLDLDEYYAHADSNSYDRYTRDAIDLDKVSFTDYQRVAEENHYDSITSPSRKNLLCSTQSEWDQIANNDPFDGITSDDWYTSAGYTSPTDFQNQQKHDPIELDYYNYPPRQDYYRQLYSPESIRIDDSGAIASWRRLN